MSQPKRRDIADFFRPLARSLPAEQSVEDEDEIVLVRTGPIPLTPRAGKSQKSKASQQIGSTRSPTRSIITPRSGRSISIPIRSPSSVTPSAIRTSQRLNSLTASRGREASPLKATSFSITDIPSSNRTVFEDGKKVAVRDSDDSDDSLASISELIGRKNNSRPALNSSQADSAAAHEAEGRQLLSSFSSGKSEIQSNRTKLRELQKREQANKVDLSYIFENERKEAEARERIAKLMADKDAPVNSEIDRSSKQKLAAVLGEDKDDEDDIDNIGRILHAVDRTEAFSSTKSYSFLTHGRPPKQDGRSLDLLDFPPTAVPGNLFEADDTAACKRMFLSGFMSDMASKGCLEDTVVRWSFDMVGKEPRLDVSEAYLACISSASSKWTRANVRPQDIQVSFESSGAGNCVFQDSIISTTRLRADPQADQCQHLALMLKLYSLICHDLDFATLSRLCSTLCRLLIDDDLMNNDMVAQAANELIQRLSEMPDQDSCQHVRERILADMSTNLREPCLQAILLQNLVVTTTSALELRRDLAIAFLLGGQKPQESETTGNRNIIGREGRLAKIYTFLLSSPNFAVRTVTNLGTSGFYTNLHALTVVLDSAIGDGQLPPKFADRNEEQSFNSDVDHIASHIQALHNSIPDAGASHMTRSEAKNALLGLHHRLVWAVRTQRKKKRHVFDATGEALNPAFRGKKKIRFSDTHETEEINKKKDFMARFLHKKPNMDQLLPEE